jgi:hypothetical protein
MNCGLCFVSSNILKIYSDNMLKNSRFEEPKNNINTITAYVPLGASGPIK